MAWNHQHNNSNNHNHAHPYRHPSNNPRSQRGGGRTRGGGGGRGGSKAPHPRRTHQQQQQQQNKTEEGETTKTEATPSDDTAPSSTTSLHCSACNITFNNEPAMKTHLAAHVKCPDCSFTASPGHVSNHRKTAHGPASNKPCTEPPTQKGAAISSTLTSKTSGLKAATQREEEDDDDDDEDDEDEESAYIKKKAQESASSSSSSKPASKFGIATPSLAMYERHPLTPTFKTEEDIKKWIAERRKHWPTVENVQRKEEERQEMIAKGQIPPGDARRGKMNQARQQRQQQQQQQQLHGKKRPNDRQADTTQEVGVKKAKTEEEGDTATIASGSGLVAYASSTSGDDDEENEGVKEKKNMENMAQPPSSVALNEDESDNEDMDPVRDAITSKDPSSMGKILLPSDRPVNTRHCKYFARGKCTRGDKCTFIHDTSMVLLSSEIKDEKNKLLEALRYIVENNFFDKAEPTGPLVQEVHATF
ncbi:hypothetical protein DFQ26_008906 [Actinomortierella ambigua]|nr:hypothetical protein DFQ26_008906 [Actinomortierella ambigua]